MHSYHAVPYEELASIFNSDKTRFFSSAFEYRRKTEKTKKKKDDKNMN